MFSQFNISYDSPRLLVAAAVIPALFLMYYIYRHDRIEKEPGGLLFKLVLFGILSAVAAGVIEALWEYFVFPQIPFPSVEAEIIALATMVGLAEEGAKLFFLKRRTWRNPEFNYRFDGIVYAVFVSLGFAAIPSSRPRPRRCRRLSFLPRIILRCLVPRPPKKAACIM